MGSSRFCLGSIMQSYLCLSCFAVEFRTPIPHFAHWWDIRAWKSTIFLYVCTSCTKQNARLEVIDISAFPHFLCAPNFCLNDFISFYMCALAAQEQTHVWKSLIFLCVCTSFAHTSYTFIPDACTFCTRKCTMNACMEVRFFSWCSQFLCARDQWSISKCGVLHSCRWWYPRRSFSTQQCQQT